MLAMFDKRLSLTHPHLLRSFVLPIVVATALAACAGKPPRHDGPDPARQDFDSHAYRTELPLPLLTHRESLAAPDGDLYVEITAPRDDGNYPAVIYLPGLAEGPADGRIWRNALAAAGYAVICVQAQADGQALLSGEAERSGDFLSIGRQAFSVESLNRRVTQALYALNSLPQLARRDAIFGRADTRRLLLVGYDLGAHTALGIASGKYAERLPAGLRGIVAISPYYNSEQIDDRLYGQMQLPILNITSSADVDDFGLVSNPASRVAPYRAMPRGDKYLLVMRSLTHRNLSGKENVMPLPSDEARQSGKHGRAGGNPPGNGGGGMGGGAGGDAGGGGGGDMRRGGMGQERGPGGMERGRGNEVPDTEQAFTVIRSVMLAFADSTLKNEGPAQDWLALDAPRWLRPLGTLTGK